MKSSTYSFYLCSKQSNAPILLDEGSGLLADHNASSVRVSRHQVRHYRGICHPAIMGLLRMVTLVNQGNNMLDSNINILSESSMAVISIATHNNYDNCDNCDDYDNCDDCESQGNNLSPCTPCTFNLESTTACLK